MPNDQFEVKMIYPTISGTNIPKSWFIADGFKSDPRVRMDDTSVSGNGNDGYHFGDNSSLRFTVSADSKDTDIGCDNDFDASTIRGYVYKPNDWMAEPNSGVEMTGFYKMSNSGPKDNPIIMKGPTGEHHSNTDCCSGASHMVHIGGVDEDIEDDIAMRFSKEMWHVDYFTRSDYQAIPNETWSISDNIWFGVKYIIYKTIVNNVKSVTLEAWLNPNGDKQTWKKVFTTTDQGGWGDSGDECNGEKDDRLAFGNARMMWRWDYRDGSDIKFKWMSIRPINPTGDFGEDPTSPPTNTPTVTTFRSTMKLQRSINSNRIGCGVGGEQVFYEIGSGGTMVERFLCDNTAQDYRTRIAQEANPVGGSSMVGKIPLETGFEIRKIGTPTGTCRAKIWNAAGVQQYQSTNTITCTSLPSSFDGILEFFDMSTNTYAIQNGDRIGVEYTASSDPSNCIALRCKDPGDGSTNTYYAYYQNDISTWGKITSRDTICLFYS